MSYLPGLGKHTPARTLVLVCQVCNNAGWMKAAKVVGQQVGEFIPVPCWACAPTHLKVMTL